MLPKHFTQEEWDKESEYLAKCQPTTKTGGTAFQEMMIPYYEWLEKQDELLPIPTHNFDLMKEARQKTYEQKLSAYKINRKNNGFEHTAKDDALFRLSWLEKELHAVESWLVDTGLREQKGHREVDIESDKAEQTRYKQYVESEREKLSNSITSTPPKQKRVNSVAKDKQKRVVEKYEAYKKRGFNEEANIIALIHDFKKEYGKGTLEHTKKAIQKIIREYNKEKLYGWNNKE